MFLVGHVSEFVEHCDFLRHHECNKCQTLYEGTKQWAYLFITLSVTLTLLQDHSSVSFNWKLHSLIWLSWNFVELLSTSSRSWIYYYFCLSHMFKRGNWYVSWFDKNCHWLFHGHCSSEVFQTVHYYSIALGLPDDTRFDNLDLISRSQICQNHNCKLFLRFLSIVVQMYSCIHKKRSSTVCFVTGVYLRDITNTFFFQFCTWMWVVLSECLLFLFNLMLINQTVRSMTPACLSLMCVFNRADIWLTVSLKISACCLYICMFCFIFMSRLGEGLRFASSPNVILCGWLGSKHQLTNNSL